MRHVGIPANVAAMPPRAVKVYAVLAANRWPVGMNVHQIAGLAGMTWHTANTALEELQAAGYLDKHNLPVGGVA